MSLPRLASWVLPGLLLALPGESRAEDELTGRPAGGVASAESAQHFALELKFGPYYPEVDSEFGADEGPYRETFGDSDLLYSGVEFDWEFVRIPGGTFSVGLGLGFMQAVGTALSESGQASGEDTVLNVLPVHIPVAFRFDYLANELGIPLVPYIKGSISIYYWWVLNAGGTAGTDDDPGWGWTPGGVLAPGIMLQLDFFEPSSARTFDSEVGVNHSYLFFEGNLAWIDNFGTGGTLDLSDLTWVGGLALEF